MKKNNSGFALAETLIVSTVVAGILIYIFVQFATVKRSYNDSFKYNTVNGLYAIEDIADYIYNLDRNVINEYFVETINDNGYLEIKKESNYIDNVDRDYGVFINDAGIELLNNLDVTEMYITKENMNDLDTSEMSPSIQSFIKRISNTQGNDYRIIVRFKDDTFATLTIKLEVA